MLFETPTNLQPAQIVYSSRRTLCLQINREGQLIIRSPRRATSSQIQNFVNSKQDWIVRSIAKILSKQAQPSIFDQLSAEEIKLVKKQAKANFETLLNKWSCIMNLKYTKLRITGAKTLWGSCSGRGTISLNWKLQLMPNETLEYVIIHELAHLKEHNHSVRFWKIVETFCSEYQQLRKQLKTVR